VLPSHNHQIILDYPFFKILFIVLLGVYGFIQGRSQV
jgi:hypothetical protein